MLQRRFLIEVDGLPDPTDRGELLELILAAATLELPVTVLLIGCAAELLSSSSNRAWRQLIDQGLTRVCVFAPPAQAFLPDGVMVLSEHQRAKLVAQSTVIRT